MLRMVSPMAINYIHSGVTLVELTAAGRIRRNPATLT